MFNQLVNGGLMPDSPASVTYDSQSFYFQNLQMSAGDFYQKVEGAVKAKKVQEIEVKRVYLSQGGFFPSRREYLRIERRGLIFDICASAFGTDFFISWWLGEKENNLALLSKLPLLGKYFDRLSKSQTYYQLDTRAMFLACIKSIVNAEIEKIEAEKAGKIKRVDVNKPETELVG